MHYKTYPFSAASWIFFGLVTVKSSPTTCRSFVTPVVNLTQLSQSSYDKKDKAGKGWLNE